MISLRRRVLQNSLLNLIASISQRAGQALVFILIARFLSNKDAGAYSLANTYTSILLAFSFWGLDQILIREVAKREEVAGRYVTGFLLLRLVLSLLLWLALALVMPLLPYSAQSKQLIRARHLRHLAAVQHHARSGRRSFTFSGPTYSLDWLSVHRRQPGRACG